MSGAPARTAAPSRPRRLVEVDPAALLRLANEIQYLAPSHRNPEAFHERKSEIRAELKRLAGGTAHT